jgi:hypothetical protein
MLPIQMWVVLICKNKKSERQSSYLCLILNYMHRLVLTHQEVFYFMDLLVQVRPCWLKPSPMNQKLQLYAWLALNLFKSILVKVQEWLEMYSDLQKRMLHQLYLLTRLMLLQQRDTIQTQVQIVKFKEF